MTLCAPCLERAHREREAYRIVDGTPMCRPCFTGSSEFDKQANSEARREGWSYKDFTHRGARELK
jgi:hypothetical protein